MSAPDQYAIKRLEDAIDWCLEKGAVRVVNEVWDESCCNIPVAKLPQPIIESMRRLCSTESDCPKCNPSMPRSWQPQDLCGKCLEEVKKTPLRIGKKSDERAD